MFQIRGHQTTARYIISSGPPHVISKKLNVKVYSFTENKYQNFRFQAAKDAPMILYFLFLTTVFYSVFQKNQLMILYNSSWLD